MGGEAKGEESADVGECLVDVLALLSIGECAFGLLLKSSFMLDEEPFSFVDATTVLDVDSSSERVGFFVEGDSEGDCSNVSECLYR